MLLGLGGKAEFVDVVDDLAQVVAALDAVLDLAEDFADLVFDGVGAGGLLLKTVQVGEELAVDELDEIVAGLGGIVVDLAVFALGRGPRFPAVGFVEDVGVFLAVQGGFGGFVVFQGVKVFQEEQPRSLLGVIEFAGAAGVFPEHVVDVFEGLFEHGFAFALMRPKKYRQALDKRGSGCRPSRWTEYSPKKRPIEVARGLLPQIYESQYESV